MGGAVHTTIIIGVGGGAADVVLVVTNGGGGLQQSASLPAKPSVPHSVPDTPRSTEPASLWTGHDKFHWAWQLTRS